MSTNILESLQQHVLACLDSTFDRMIMLVFTDGNSSEVMDSGERL